MSEKREVVVLSAVRSAIGTFGGLLANMELCELAGTGGGQGIAVVFERV